MSSRVAAALTGGVSHTKVVELRKWKEAGGEPDALPDLQAEKIRALKVGTRLAADEDFRRAALRLAADRLEKLVEGLRKEAATPGGAASAPVADADRKLAEQKAVERGKPHLPRRVGGTRPGRLE